MRTRPGIATLAATLLLAALSAGNCLAYNILSVDMGGYWNNLFDQYVGAREGMGQPGLPGERWYTTVDYRQLGSVDLHAYDVLLVQSGFTDDWVQQEAVEALAALRSKSSDILDFVRHGNGLVAWSEPFPDGRPNVWDWAPVEVVSQGIEHQNGVEIVDPSHPAMEHSTSASLSDWQCSWHGTFTQWDPRLDVLARTAEYAPKTGMQPYGSGTPGALTLAGTFNDGGCGRMLFSMQDPDYHAYQGWDGARTFVGDALDWAAVCEPVPEPSSVLLLLGGLGAAAACRPRRRRPR